jgi:hypothetical protein
VRRCLSGGCDEKPPQAHSGSGYDYLTRQVAALDATVKVAGRQGFLAGVLDGADDRRADRAVLRLQRAERVLDPPADGTFIHIGQRGQLINQDHDQRLSWGWLVQPGHRPAATFRRRMTTTASSSVSA